MIDALLTVIFYLGLVTTGLALVVLFLLLHEGYEMTKEQKEVKPEKNYIFDYGLTRHELNRVVAQVMKNDRQRTVRKRGYKW